MIKSPERIDRTPPEEKREILSRAMYYNQPDFDDFSGYPGFPEKMLQSDQDKLEQKNIRDSQNARVQSDDDFAHKMEPILTYILNGESLLPSRDSFSFLASEYDDKLNGTDIVFGVKNSHNGSHMVFSIDSSTGTNPLSVQEKFRNSYERHDGLSYVKYCMHKNQRWREPEAPHFILGMSPASQLKALDKIIITNGELKGRENDLDTDFILLSEMREQVYMGLALLRNKPKTPQTERRIFTLNNFLPAINTGLYRVLGILESDYPSKEERSKALEKKYQKKLEELAHFDDVYKNIIVCSRKRTRGAMSLSAS